MTTSLTDKTLIIFDWDGTLQDTIGLIVESMHIAGESQGLSTTDEAIKGIIGLELMLAIQTLYPQADDNTHQAILQSYADYYIANAHTCTMYDGVVAMLNKLHDQGKTLAVATGKKRVGLIRSFGHSGVEQLFSISRCADETLSKPDPLMLNEIMQETGTTVEQAVFIGDSIYDIRMAKAIEMDSIAVNYGCEKAEVLAKESPTYQVNSVTELAALLDIT